MDSQHLFKDFGGVLDELGADGPEEALFGGPLGAFGRADVAAEQLLADERVVSLLELGGELADGGVDGLTAVPLVAVGSGVLEAEDHEGPRDRPAGLGQPHATGEARRELDPLLARQAE